MRSKFTAEAIKHNIPALDYWKSGDAIKLFNPLPGEPVQETLHRRNNILLDFVNHPEQHVAEMFEGYAELPPLTVRQMDQVLKQSLYLAKAYENAMIHMGTAQQACWTWTQCCDAAIDELSTVGITKIRNSRTLGRWNIYFRHNEVFLHPVYRCKPAEPKLFACFPEVKDKIHAFCRKKENLASLSVESLRNEIVDTIVPAMYETLLQEQRELDGFEEEEFWTKEEMLAYLDLKSISPSTVWNWMQLLGYKYSETKKCYYVDGHENQENVEARKRFISEYWKNEIRAHRWIQLTVEQAHELENDQKDPLRKHTYCSYIKDGVAMREYHVDMHDRLVEFVRPELIKYGGNLSIRKSPTSRVVMFIGQDESAFHQFIFPKKQWVGPDGTRLILPKGEGEGYMASGFQAREIGLGLRMTVVQRADINSRREGKFYKNSWDAESLHGTAKKPQIADDEDPLLRWFRFGANHDGYWSNSHMKLQLEDVIDCLVVVFPQFDIIFLFDQSAGHTKRREDGLSVTNMNAGFGGKRPTMHDTTLHEVGPHGARLCELNLPLLSIGDSQCLVFPSQEAAEDTTGPYWLSVPQRRAMRVDRIKGRIKRQKTVLDLLKEVQASGFDTMKRRFLKSELLVIAVERGISVEVEEDLVDEGWCGKAKGLKQVLFERGWINPDVPHNRYTMKGKREDLDETGNLNEEGKNYCLPYLLNQCKDFREEKTDLEYMVEELGLELNTDCMFRILFTPKYHCEMAGEGIEFSWGAGKRCYRKLPVQERKSFAGFQQSVKRSLAYVNINMCRKFSRRARRYMLTYHHYTLEGDGHAMGFQNIEKLCKAYKSHRDANIFDGKYILQTLRESCGLVDISV
jgi:hypothetical protein